jgi:uncharacterized phiE125 gp8 family phage protein
MAGRLKLITGPAAEPVTAADLRAFGRISSDVLDATLTPLLAAARQLAEDYLNRALINQTYELVYDDFPDLPFSLPMPPLSALTSAKVTDTTGAVTTMDNSDFVVDSSGGMASMNLKNGKAWPAVTPGYAGVAIRYVTGYGATGASVPDSIKLAIKAAALSMYDNPSADFSAVFHALLDPERVMPV